MNIAILGAGNLGISIVTGLLENNFDPSQITLTRNKIELLQNFSDKGVKVTKDNKNAVENSDIVIIAVKPYRIAEILQEIAPVLKKNTILVSLVSDFSIEEIENNLSTKPVVVRAMPNTATSVSESITCLASNNASIKDIQVVESIFKSLGETIVINETLMDAATILGACGIAYVLRFMRGMIQGGIEIGFDAHTASKIVMQTVKGASELLIQKGNHPEAEIDKVTTPKGCTITGLNEMEHNGFSSALIKGIKTSYDKIS